MTASAVQPTEIFVAADPKTLAELYAEWLIGRLSQTTGRFRIALCGGASPRPLYQLLGSGQLNRRIDWSRFEIYWGDERFVAPTAPDSNYAEAHALWLRHVPIPAAQLHPMPTAGAIEDCARAYEELLRTSYGSAQLAPDRPLFDVVLLGVGENGHTASLMPGSDVLAERTHWVAPLRTGMPQMRLTLTYPALASARAVTFIATGANKTEIVRRVRAGERSLPAAQITSDGELFWFLDSMSAGQIQPKRKDGGKN
ncbi:MAG: 6-phosphogluconolactonase [Alphaproteobacteria bacterium]|nr:6-phosphogluconolactonase [Alphaproteobacteria bacterium]